METLYAKPFSKNATEERVTELFAAYGRVLNVELRKDEAGSFRGSVFVTFADSACAASAMSNPPLQLGSTTERLQVMLKPDYERKVASKQGKPAPAGKHASKSKAHSRGHGNGTGSGRSGSHKRSRDSDREHERDRDRGREPPPYPASGSGPAPAPPPAAGASGQQHHDAAPPPPPGPGSVSGSDAAQVAHWQGLAEQRERRIAELEERVKAEKEAREAASSRANQAMYTVDEAQARERAASARLLAKEAEAGSLKGQVESLRSCVTTRVQEVHMQYKARIHEVEVQLQQLKDENAALKLKLLKMPLQAQPVAAAAAEKAALDKDDDALGLDKE